MKGKAFNESHLEEYMRENLVPNCDPELDKRDVFVLANIIALLSQRGHFLLRELVDDNLNKTSKVLKYGCNVSFEYSVASITVESRRHKKKIITSLSIGKTRRHVDYPEKFYQLLGQFTGLQDLTIYGCSSFESLCENLLKPKNNDSCGFSNLLSLKVSVSHYHFANPIACLVKVAKEATSNANIYNFNRLETLEFVGRMTVDETVLEDFFFEILPLFPSLSSFSVESNKVRSFQKIAQHLIQQQQNDDSTNLHFFKLRKLDLGVCNDDSDGDNDDVGARELLRHNALEIEAVTTILKAFPGLNIQRSWCHRNSETGFHYRGAVVPCPIHPSLEYLSEINHAGRALVEISNHNATTTAPSFALPLSVWPLVLARAGKVRRRTNQNIRKDIYTFSSSPNAIYYLFRNTPELYTQAGQRPCVHSKKNTNPSASSQRSIVSNIFYVVAGALIRPLRTARENRAAKQQGTKKNDLSSTASSTMALLAEKIRYATFVPDRRES